ncbi:hypothetical protein A9Q94_01510 [Rhodobacterales bacterium 56_14_T64]|nr:hypothetical protein A9Q94_01510 [Rhodobacterales bacterium 56_14_T64]
MLRLALVLYSLIATSLAGTGVIFVLVAGYVSVPAIIAAAAVGAVLALPASWLVARKIVQA